MTIAASSRSLTRPSVLAWLLLGVGLGGFVDGIVLHQILQWHHLVSDVAGYEPSSLAALRVNTIADGAFHAVMWLAVLGSVIAGVVAWQQGRPAPTWRHVSGYVLMGWGIFNLVEGIALHHVLGAHHVRDDLGGPLAWDVAFLALSLGLVFVGWALVRASSPVRRA